MPRPLRLPILLCGILAGLVLAPPPGRAEPESAVPACYTTGGGALEICRSLGEPEGVFFAPPSCQFAYDVQILRLKGRAAAGPLQVIYHGEPRRAAPGSRESGCEGGLRATEDGVGGSVRSGRLPEQLATTMPPTDYRFWGLSSREEARQERPPRKRRRGRRAREAPESAREAIRAAAAAAKEGSGGRDPMTVAGRDWAGDDYFYLFMIASETVGNGRRHVLIQGRTYDFEKLDVRARREGSDVVEWLPFGAEDGVRRRRRPPEPPALAAISDESGLAITANCAAEGFDPRGLIGSISLVEQVYHYFYTDVMPSDCGEPPAKRRMGLYLRTSRDVSADRPWSAAKAVVEGLPPDTLVRVAKAKGMDRWAVAYSCFRPANAPGGPVADICLQYTADLSPGSIADLAFYAEPATAVRSPAYLGLRSGGDSSGRYSREGFFWMTDRYGNLDTPAIYPGKGGFLTWLDRSAPRMDGAETSTLYGRPVYWSTWTVKPR